MEKRCVFPDMFCFLLSFIHFHSMNFIPATIGRIRWISRPSLLFNSHIWPSLHGASSTYSTIHLNKYHSNKKQIQIETKRLVSIFIQANYDKKPRTIYMNLIETDDGGRSTVPAPFGRRGLLLIIADISVKQRLI